MAASEPVPARGTRLGTRRGLLSLARVYRTADALEVDEVEGYDVARRSVLFDEVLLVSYHRELGWPLLLALAVLLSLASLVSALVALASPSAGLATFALIGLPWLALGALRLVLRVDVVTVYGVRTKATMPFWFRKRRAREVFTLVCRLAREHQQPRRVDSAVPRSSPE
jgi:hypothetical protein